jgi:4-amino-4-deoxy-L-arabinose transferase-like glycosyltransferase
MTQPDVPSTSEPASSPSPATLDKGSAPPSQKSPSDHWNRSVGLDWHDLAIALLLGVSYIILLVKTAHVQGYARDEGFYFSASEHYARFFQALLNNPSQAIKRPFVDSIFVANHEHPVFVKSLFSLSWLFLYKKWHLFAEEGTSFRFPGMVFAGSALSLLYLWGKQAFDRHVGLIAALLYALVPTTFYHAHLDCFDVPIATMWLFTAYCFYQAHRNGGWGWAITTGIVYGFTLNTKHNSWFLPIALLAFSLLARGTKLTRDGALSQLRIPKAWLAMVTLGPLVCVATWPWLWHDTARRFHEYMLFHLHHDYYNMEFLGTTYWKPPFPRSYAWLMTAATVPMVTLALFGLGLGRSLVTRGFPYLYQWLQTCFRTAGRSLPSWIPPFSPAPRDPTSVELLWAIALVINYAPWLSRGTPIFGGTKHWLTAYPFLCLFAGLGFRWLVSLVRSTLPSNLPNVFSNYLLVPLLGVSVVIAPAVETLRVHPWGLASYTPLVGGNPGAATLGLNRSFWGYTTGSVVEFLNEHVPRYGTVYVHDTAWSSWTMLQHDGRLRKDIRGVGSPAGADAALYHHEQHMEGVEYQIWVAMGTTSPALVAGPDFVPTIWVYLRPPGKVKKLR